MNGGARCRSLSESDTRQMLFANTGSKQLAHLDERQYVASGQFDTSLSYDGDEDDNIEDEITESGGGAGSRFGKSRSWRRKKKQLGHRSNSMNGGQGADNRTHSWRRRKKQEQQQNKREEILYGSKGGGSERNLLRGRFNIGSYANGSRRNGQHNNHSDDEVLLSSEHDMAAPPLVRAQTGLEPDTTLATFGKLASSRTIAASDDGKGNGGTDEPAPATKPIPREQLIDSLAWFSFHTPRCVVEDLTQHELDQEVNFEVGVIQQQEQQQPFPLWKQQQQGGLERGDDAREDEGRHQNMRALSDETGSLSSMTDDEDSIVKQQQQGDGDEENITENQILTGSPQDHPRVACRASEFSLLSLPYNMKRECALVFVDISGFTKLSTVLDVESLSKVS